MKRFFRILSALLYTLILTTASSGVVKADSSELPQYRFTKTNGLSDGGASEGMFSATDSNNNTYTLSVFGGTVTFDPIGNHDTISTPLNGMNPGCAVTKYSSSGAYVWTKAVVPLDQNSGAFCFGLTVAPNGTVYIGGVGSGTVGIGDQSYFNPDSFGFVAAYDNNGNFIRDYIIPSGSNGYIVDALTTDASNNLYISGSVTGTVTFDGLNGSNTQTFSSFQSYITKYDDSGNYKWTKITNLDPSDSNTYSSSIKLDKNGNIYLCGYHELPSPAVNSGEGFVSKYDSSGNVIWTKYLASSDNSYVYPQSLVLDDSNNIYLGGQYSGSITFDGRGGSVVVDDSSTTGNNNKYNAFITKLTNDGNYTWTKTFKNSDGNSTVYINSLSYYNNGLYAVGSWSGTVHFNPASNANDLTSANDSAFLIGVDLNGGFKFVRTVDTGASSTTAYHNSSSVDKLGNIYIVGIASGTPIFNSSDPTSSITIGDGGGVPSAFTTSYFLGLPAIPATPNTGSGKFENIFSETTLIIGAVTSFVIISSAILLRNKAKSDI